MGTLAYLNWKAANAGQQRLHGSEYGLFTDAHLIGGRIKKFGPYEIHRAKRSKDPDVPAAYLIVDYRHPDDGGLGVPFDGLHGIYIQKEIAALVSLSLGIRLSATMHSLRIFGKTDAFSEEREPFRFPTQRPSVLSRSVWSMIPSASGGRDVRSISLLSCLPVLNPDDTFALLRSSLLYSNALWCADEQPELAWVLLVSAVEAAAAHWGASNDAKVDVFEESKIGMQVASILKDNDAVHLLPAVSNVLKEFSGSTRKFIDFLLHFRPGPPDGRSRSEEVLFPWEEEKLRRAFGVIYGHRSTALHSGVPFPPPMCSSPYYVGHGLAEVPGCFDDQGEWRGWKKKHCPMLLHTFEYIVRRSLQSWWMDMAKTS